MKKRAITLIEVLISISLLSVLLFALLSSYSQLKMVDAAIAKENIKNFESRHLESKLQAILIQAVEVEKDTTFFYTDTPSFSSSPSLVFSYNAEAKLNPKFSGIVLGRLFVDSTGNLTLATWPSPTRYSQPPIPMVVEVLATHVKSIAFSFYAPPNKDIKVTEGSVSEAESNKWHSEWRKNYQKLPPLIKLQIVKESLETVDFSFYLANNQYPLKL